MILGHHLILSAYGFWIPNDSRGSWSSFVRSYELYRAAGRATKVDTHRSVARRPRDHSRDAAGKAALARKAAPFDGHQARAIARGFADYAKRADVRVHACAVLPDHAHLVVARHRLPVERMCEQFKAAATAQLKREGRHPFAHVPYANGRLPSPWARKGWWVFLDSVAELERSVRYVDANPERAGLPRQRWSFVVPIGRVSARAAAPLR